MPSSRQDSAARGIVWGIGAHVIKTGVSPVLIDLMERGYVSALAMNGAGIIHDFEIALVGRHVGGRGRSARARAGSAWPRRPARILNEVIRARSAGRQGLGQAVARVPRAPQARRTCRAQSRRRRHIGSAFRSRCTWRSAPTSFTCTRTRQAPPSATTSLRDFRYFTSCVARLTGGVYLNCGSAVVLPEVFLKAVALARNQGASLDGLTTVNIDFMRMYRPQTNVVTRPVAGTNGHGNFPRRPPRDPDSADCRGCDRTRLGS